MTDSRDQAAERLDEIAAELEQAAAHCRVVPRAAAHAWAAFGHVQRGNSALIEMAEAHAAHAIPSAE
jgi:aspartate/glutamate racemase